MCGSRRQWHAIIKGHHFERGVRCAIADALQEQNPHGASVERLGASVAAAQAQLAELEGARDQLEQECQDYKQVCHA